MGVVKPNRSGCQKGMCKSGLGHRLFRRQVHSVENLRMRIVVDYFVKDRMQTRPDGYMVKTDKTMQRRNHAQLKAVHENETMTWAMEPASLEVPNV